MLIAGWRKSVKVYAQGPSAPCPRCGCTSIVFAEKKSGPTLFFIPLTGSNYLCICPQCEMETPIAYEEFVRQVNICNSASAMQYGQSGYAGIPGYTPPAQMMNGGMPGYVPQDGAKPYMPPGEQPVPQAVLPQPGYEEQLAAKKEYVRQEVERTQKYYKKEGWLNKDGLRILNERFSLCPFCGQIADWAANAEECRCNNCLAEIILKLKMNQQEIKKIKVRKAGVFNMSALKEGMIFENAEQLSAAAQGLRNPDEKTPQ